MFKRKKGSLGFYSFHIFAITIIFVMMGLVLFYIIEDIKKADIATDFCEANGFKRGENTYNYCYKMEGNEYIIKKIKIVNGRGYFLNENR